MAATSSLAQIQLALSAGRAHWQLQPALRALQQAELCCLAPHSFSFPQLQASLVLAVPQVHFSHTEEPDRHQPPGSNLGSLPDGSRAGAALTANSAAASCFTPAGALLGCCIAPPRLEVSQAAPWQGREGALSSQPSSCVLPAVCLCQLHSESHSCSTGSSCH